ncbi:MAG: hypothetical protein FJ134_10645 [Deltaproteobacteria bacterium]|nr:hypothetical protein [Deltaproteobacteria bacterium]
MPWIFLKLDPYLIWLYRITGYAWVDFFFGTLVLAFIAVIIGEFTISLLFLAIRNHIDRINAEVDRYYQLSIEALKAGDKETYRSVNKLGNDAFGKSFFLQLGLSAARLWPVFIPLAWMQHRFAGVEFPIPLTSISLGYMGVFILLYIGAFLAFKRIKRRLPYFRRIQEILDSYKKDRDRLKNSSNPEAMGITASPLPTQSRD